MKKKLIFIVQYKVYFWECFLNVSRKQTLCYYDEPLEFHLKQRPASFAVRIYTYNTAKLVTVVFFISIITTL